ncbi:MAG TPA: hypothetical protein VLB84_18615 [Bacteroidia bacterium]|nr:hypothetical protein [Bacteroidia bacterium]
MNKLKQKELIKSAESLINNEQLGFAAEIEKPIQEIKSKNGALYQLSVVVKYVR